MVESARTELERLQNLPRPEEVPISEATVLAAKATLQQAESHEERLRKLLDQNAVSPDEYEQARSTKEVAKAEVERAAAQLALLQSGSWKYDLQIAQANLEQARQQLASVDTQIELLTLRAQVDGEVLQVNVRPGEFVGPGVNQNLMVLGNTGQLHLRVDIDEHDIPRFDDRADAVACLKGQPQSRFPLTFVRYEPFVIPKRSLTGENTERTDTRVLQVIYRIEDGDRRLFVGQQMDVFIDAQNASDADGQR